MQRILASSWWLRVGILILAQVPGGIALATDSIAVAADPNAAGLADACTSCHGIGGRSQGYIPTIAGVERATLLRELLAFRVPNAPATIMNRIARVYTDPELEALANYFSALPRP